MNDFTWTVRVYYEDTDAGGVVYHAKYLNFFERARTEWLRSCGINQRELVKKNGIVFTIRRMAIDFVRPAMLDDELEIGVSLKQLNGASIQLNQSMIKTGDGEEIAQAEVLVACIDAKRMTPVRIPKQIMTEIRDGV